MNNREGVNRKREYYDWLKAVVAEPLNEDYKTSMATFMGLDSVSDEAKETIKLSTEVVQPFSNALAYIVNNRFIIEDKAFLMENETDDPPMSPQDIFAVLDYLIPSTVREFLGVLKVDSVMMEKTSSIIAKIGWETMSATYRPTKIVMHTINTGKSVYRKHIMV